MAACALTDPCWVEVGTLKHYVLGGLVSTATLTAEYTGNTHGVLGIADSQIAVAQLVLLAIQCLEWSALGHGLYYYLMTLYHVGIKGVQRLSVSHHHVVGDIHDIVDGAQSDGVQLVLQPVGTLLYLTVADAYAGIALAGLSVLNFYLDGQVVIVNSKLRAVGAMHLGLVAIALQPGIQVACHTPVAQSISAVGGDINLNQPVALQVVVLCSRCAHYSILGQYDNTVVTGTYANLVLGTDHTVALYAAQLALLNHKLLIAIVKHAAQIGHNHLLTSGYVRRTAHNLRWLTLAQVNRCYMQMV